jgi:hypothetical protein
MKEKTWVKENRSDLILKELNDATKLLNDLGYDLG